MLADLVLANASIVSLNRILLADNRLVVPYDIHSLIYERHQLDRYPDTVTFRMLRFPIKEHQKPKHLTLY